MLSLTGPGHTSDFLEGSNREFEKSKGGVPPSFGFGRCLLGALSLASRSVLWLRLTMGDKRVVGGAALEVGAHQIV
jgi:hypothetical protein